MSVESVDHVHLPTPIVERGLLSALYVDVLLFADASERDVVCFRADNCEVRFDRLRDSGSTDFRPLRVVVASLQAIESSLIDAGIEYERQRGIVAGQDVLVVKDADGNWLTIRECRRIG